MQRLCKIAVAGLSVKPDSTAGRLRLLTVVLSCGPEDDDARLDAPLEAVATDDAKATGGLLSRCGPEPRWI